MKHPARKVRNKALWFGPEVEGCLANVPTAFVRKALSGDDTKRLFGEGSWRQLFLTEEFDGWAWLEKFWGMIQARATVTKACYPEDIKGLRRRRRTPMALFVRVEAPWANTLLPKDQISLGVSYSMYSAQVGKMFRTVPGDYRRDVP